MDGRSNVRPDAASGRTLRRRLRDAQDQEHKRGPSPELQSTIRALRIMCGLRADGTPQ
jgi:hypothetical protein